MAVILAFILTEYFVSNIIHYPKYGLNKKIFFSKIHTPTTKIYLPYSEYWTVEGDNKVYKRNNIGLPGIDVSINDNFRNIFVLGSSFIESLSVPPENMTTSRLQEMLRKDFGNYNVLNLGYAGYTTYQDFMRALYFEKYYQPERVILVIQGVYEDFPLSDDAFDLIPNFGETDYSFSSMFTKAYGNNSSFLYLLASAGKRSKDVEVEKEIRAELMAAPDSSSKETEEAYKNSLIRLEICLKNFKKKFGNKFIFVSMTYEEKNEELRIMCDKIGVNFISKNILSSPEWRIKGYGHLNIEGSKVLSNLLYEAFIKFNEK